MVIGSFFDQWVNNNLLLNLIEGVVRMIIFMVYMLLVSRMNEMKRVFAYHGAEHKTIRCYEAGLPLTVENVRAQTRLHPRCGTSFLLVIMVISILVFSVASTVLLQLFLQGTVFSFTSSVAKELGASSFEIGLNTLLFTIVQVAAAGFIGKKVLKKLSIAQLKDGVPVWFGCDSGAYGDRTSGVWDPESFAYGNVLGGADFFMNKKDRLEYRDSFATHAMILTGVNLDENGKPDRWKIENSWGKDVGKNGYFVCSDHYFDEFVYEVIIDRKYLNEVQKTLLEEEPYEIMPWQV
jgi:hypothetical protein